jgi:hypothetical protein
MEDDPPFTGVTEKQCGQFDHIVFWQLKNQRLAVLSAWISCPLPAAFSGSPL